MKLLSGKRVERQIASKRKQIDAIDLRLLALLRRRFDVAQDLGRLKGQLHLPARQPARFRQVMESRLQWAKAVALRPEFVRALLHLIHRESLEVQSKLSPRPPRSQK